MKIWFNDPGGVRFRCEISRAWVTGLIRKVLHAMEESRAEVGLTLTDDREIRRLNRQYRGIDRPTDVLAFAMREESGICSLSGGSTHLLGDVVVSVETARRQAERQGHPLRREMSILIIHGLLHLMGFDHERSRAAARSMRKKEKELLKLDG
jgi:probable rRNA maturation factor